MEYRIIIRVITNIATLLLLIIVFLSCSSPLDVDADRGDKKIIGEKVYDISIIPDTLDFGIVHPNRNKSLEFSIQNETNGDFQIDKLIVQNYSEFSIEDFANVLLKKKGDTYDKHSFKVNFHGNKFGRYVDSIYVNELLNPDLKVIAIIPGIYGEDLTFQNVSVGEIGSQFLYIINISDQDAYLNDIQISDNVFKFKSLNNNELIVKANETKELIITFEPEISKTYNAYIKFNVNNYPYPIDNNITLTGIVE